MRTLIIAAMISSTVGACVPACARDSHRTCNVAVGECECNPGFKEPIFSGLPCVNIDECSENVNICGLNSVCTDTSGSYDCKCDDGFELIGGTCVDINECDLGTHNCDLMFTSCFNREGSFNCELLPCADPNQIRDPITFACNDPTCQTGYQYVAGSGCIDVNECLDVNTCTVGQVCVNLNGGYTCVSLPGVITPPTPPTPPAQCADVETRAPVNTVWPASATRKDFGGAMFSFNSIPQYLDGTKMYTPQIAQGDDLHLTCCDGECQFFVAIYNCLPCSSTYNGEFNGALAAASWESTSCAPAFNVVGRNDGPKPMVVFHKVLQQGDSHTFSLGAASTSVPFIAVFQKDVPSTVSCPLNKGPFPPQNTRDCSVC
eukprot:TRINITY_DN979_c0_g2_i1.p1 TRINITY_DN979_c0_g2~~TRINITY_DN979_c0_g2_i1.p1  ORF type:complete len:374 (+),score=82.22 TRINITY_DN979_c0_g2_i1:67-1188(+)